jgi:solute carrier family 10 (sodium/bile acid cotransporter), member 7
MLEILKKRWFLVSLAVLIPSGLLIGMQPSLAPHIGLLKSALPPRAVTAIVLFLMSLSLNSRQLGESLRSPGPVLWAATVNYGFIPLAALGIMSFQLVKDFQFGLIIAAVVPCTMAAASVWTRKAKGNDAVSLLVTVTTNGLCFLITPFWLYMATRSSVSSEGWVAMLVWRLVLAVLIPAFIGQLLRLSSRVAAFADGNKTVIGVVAQSCILVIVLTAACDAGSRLNGDAGSPTLLAVLLVWGSCVALHLAAMAVGVTGGRLFRFRREDIVAVAFSSSQKTLPIGVLLATDPEMLGNPDLGIPFAVFPILMYHASQLFIDTVIADRFAEKAAATEKTPATADADTTPAGEDAG